MDDRQSLADVFIGFMSGLVLGAVVGLLNAPRPGRETRAILKEKAAELRGKVGEVAEDARMDAREWRVRLRKE